MATYTIPAAPPAACVPPPCVDCGAPSYESFGPNGLCPQCDCAANNLCVNCGKPSRANDNLCESCFRASAHLCHYCGEPLPEGEIGATCWPCAKLVAEQAPTLGLPF
jgi:hypothetical protein